MKAGRLLYSSCGRITSSGNRPPQSRYSACTEKAWMLLKRLSYISRIQYIVRRLCADDGVPCREHVQKIQEHVQSFTGL